MTVQLATRSSNFTFSSCKDFKLLHCKTSSEVFPQTGYLSIAASESAAD